MLYLQQAVLHANEKVILQLTLGIMYVKVLNATTLANFVLGIEI